MSAAENKAIVHRFLDEFFNQGKWDIAEELCGEHFVNHDPAAPHARDRHGLVQNFKQTTPASQTGMSRRMRLLPKVTWS